MEKTSPFRPGIARTMAHLGQCDAIAARRYISPATVGHGRVVMLRTFAIGIAGAGLFACLPLASAWACDDDRYPCPLRSEALIEEAVQATDQLVPDEPQKKSAQPQKKAKQPVSTNDKAHAKRDREAARAAAGAKVSKPAAPPVQAPAAVSQKVPEAAPIAAPALGADEQPLNHEGRGASLVAAAGTAWPVSPIPKTLPARGGRASTPPTPHRIRCKWSTQTRSMRSIGRRASSCLGSTIFCGRWE